MAAWLLRVLIHWGQRRDVVASVASPSRVRLLCGILLLFYVGVVLTVTMWPTQPDPSFQSAVTRLLDILHRYGVPEWFGVTKLEFSANIAMFVPLGFLLTLTLPQRAWWVALLLLPSFSGAIELTQGQWLTARFATWSDVIANTLGGWIGLILAALVRAVVHTRDRLLIAQVLAGNPRNF